MPRMHDSLPAFSPPSPALRRAPAPHAHALLLLEALHALARLPRPSEAHARALPAGRRFALARGSFAGVIVPLVVISLLVDTPLCALFIHAQAPAPLQWPLHALVLFAGLWALAWAVGLRSATQRIAHVLNADHLLLAIGFRPLVRVPIAQIADVHLVKEHPRTWREAHGLSRFEIESVTAFDPPTLLIELDAPLASGRRWLATFVDDAPALREALLAAARRQRGDGHS